MAPSSKVYIAGIGCSPAPPGSSAKFSISALVSAATKALLDAGVTYDDVTQTVMGTDSNTPDHASGISNAFNDGGINVDEVERGSEFDRSFSLVRDQGARCVLMTTVEKSAAVALILVSNSFLHSRPYLKDSAALICEASAPPEKVDERTREGLSDVCETVWTLRGWSHARGAAKEDHLHCRVGSSRSFDLSRADASNIPEWKEVEFKQDGKHRLGYNPAVETRDISQEDIEAVIACGKWDVKGGSSIQFKRKGGDRAALSKL